MKHLLALACLILIIGLVFLVLRWPQGASKTFSQHAAAQKTSSIYYFLLFAIVIPILTVFFWGYFIPTHGLPVGFAVAIAGTMITQLLAAAIPEIDGWRSTVHRYSAGLSAFGLFVAMAIAVFWLELPTFMLWFGIAALVIMLVCGVEVARHRFAHRYFLWFQAIYYALFFGTVLLVMYGQ